MTPTQKLQFVQLATAHGYTAAIRLLRAEHGPEVFAGSGERLATGDRNARSSETQRRRASALRHLHRRTR